MGERLPKKEAKPEESRTRKGKGERERQKDRYRQRNRETERERWNRSSYVTRIYPDILIMQANKFHLVFRWFEFRFHLLQPKESGKETRSRTKLNEPDSPLRY